MLRSQARWVENGEKNTRYFPNLEKRHADKKRVSELKLDSGPEVSDVDSILKEEANFYKSLYTSGNDDVEDSQYDVFFKNSLILPLSAENANICEGKLSEKECRLALSEMHHRKSPGSDGFTSEFYKFFWKEIADDVVSNINYAFEKGELFICQKRGVITLLPKKGKPPNSINNLRPISLLNTDYKIASKALAKRLEKVLPDVIYQNQTGYVKKRYIGENIGLISDVLNFTKIKNKPGAAIFVDFKKAFDSIKWDYLSKVLDIFNFKDDFKKWIKCSTLTSQVAC